MPHSDEKLSLEELLEHCSDQTSGKREYAWRQLLSIYKQYMYKAISSRCLGFRLESVRRNMQTICDEVIDEVVYTLCRNDCKVLKSFRHRDKEKVFRTWLARVCNTCAWIHVQRNYITPIYYRPLDEIRPALLSINPDELSELYEEHVTVLRTCREHAGNIERDINIFKLYVWEDFTMDMLRTIPCYRDLGGRVVDDVVHRLRTCLREKFGRGKKK